MKIIFISVFISKNSAISEKNANNQQFDQSTDVDSENSKKNFQTINQKKNVWRLWHERLKYVNSARMKLLIDQMIDMKIDNFSKKSQLLCEICDYFKFIKKIHRDLSKRTFWRLKKIYTNVWNSFWIFNFEKNHFFWLMTASESHESRWWKSKTIYMKKFKNNIESLI